MSCYFKHFSPFFLDHILVPSLAQSPHVVVRAQPLLAVAHDRLHLVVVRDPLVDARHHLVDARHVVVHRHREEENGVIPDLRHDLQPVRRSVGDLRHDDHIHDGHRTGHEDTLHPDDLHLDGVQGPLAPREGI